MTDFFDQTLHDPGRRRGRYGKRLQELNNQGMPEAGGPAQGTSSPLQDALRPRQAADPARPETSDHLLRAGLPYHQRTR